MLIYIYIIPSSSTQQGYVVVQSEMRFRLLYTFLKKNQVTYR
jgi:hypothetical protein